MIILAREVSSGAMYPLIRKNLQIVKFVGILLKEVYNAVLPEGQEDH